MRFIITPFVEVHDAEAAGWLRLFGQDTGSYSAVLCEGDDITHTYYTGSHVECLHVMRDILRKQGHTFSDDYGVDLLNNATGRLMSWSIR